MRRKVDVLQDDIKDALKSEAKGIIGLILKAIIGKLVAAVLRMLSQKGWIPDLEEPSPEEKN